MVSKKKGIMICSLVVLSAVAYPALTFIWVGATNPYYINVTVLWDEPGEEYEDYKRMPTEPTNIEVRSIRISSFLDRTWEIGTLAGNVTVLETDTGVYTGTGIVTILPWERYFVLGPQSGIFLSNGMTWGELDKAKKINNVTLHYWVHPLDTMRREALKPAIYLYHSSVSGVTDTSYSETLSVSMPTGYATKTIPEIPLSSNISWVNCEVFPNSQIRYEGDVYPYLFYEAKISGDGLQSLDHGWVIQQNAGMWAVNGVPVGSIKKFFQNSLAALGLYASEIEDFTDYWIDERSIFSEEGTYLLKQIPVERVEAIFRLTTAHDYSVTRVFFTYEFSPVIGDPPALLLPESCSIPADSDFILHEWGLIF